MNVDVTRLEAIGESEKQEAAAPPVRGTIRGRGFSWESIIPKGSHYNLKVKHMKHW